MATIGEGLASFGRNFAAGRAQQARLEENRLIREQQTAHQKEQMKMQKEYNDLRAESIKLDIAEKNRNALIAEEKKDFRRLANEGVANLSKRGPATESLRALAEGETTGVLAPSGPLVADTPESQEMAQFLNAPDTFQARQFTEEQIPVEMPESVKKEIESDSRLFKPQQTEFGRDLREVVQGLLRPGYSSSPTSKLAKDVDKRTAKLLKRLDADPEGTKSRQSMNTEKDLRNDVEALSLDVRDKVLNRPEGDEERAAAVGELVNVINKNEIAGLFDKELLAEVGLTVTGNTVAPTAEGVEETPGFRTEVTGEDVTQFAQPTDPFAQFIQPAMEQAPVEGPAQGPIEEPGAFETVTTPGEIPNVTQEDIINQIMNTPGAENMSAQELQAEMKNQIGRVQKQVSAQELLKHEQALATFNNTILEGQKKAMDLNNELLKSQGMDPESQKLSIGWLGGQKVQSPTILKEVVGDASTSKLVYERGQELLSLLDQISSGEVSRAGTPKKFLELKAKADTIVGFLKGSLRLPIVGPGALSEAEIKILENVAANPAEFFRLAGSTRAALKSMQSEVARNFSAKAEGYGLDLTKRGGSDYLAFMDGGITSASGLPAGVTIKSIKAR